MIPAIRSEFRKFFTTRLWWGMAIAIFVAGGAFARPVHLRRAPRNDRRPGRQRRSSATTPRSPTPSTPSGISVGYLLLLTIGVMSIGSEYRHKTISATFLATPRRTRAMLAKVVSLIGIGAIYGVHQPGRVGRGRRRWASALIDQPLFPSSAVVRSLALSLLVLGLWALIGLGIGILIPNQVAALLIGVGVAWIVEPILGLALGAWDVRARAHRRVPARRRPPMPSSTASRRTPTTYGSSGGAEPWCSRPTRCCSPGSASGARRAPTSADDRAGGPCGGRSAAVGDDGRFARTRADRPSQRAHHSPVPRRAVRAPGIGWGDIPHDYRRAEKEAHPPWPSSPRPATP